MYRLQLLQADQWSLLDERDDEVFRGTLSDCESWLDDQDHPPPQRRSSSFSNFRLRDWIHRIWAGAPITPLHCSTAVTSEPNPPRS